MEMGVSLSRRRQSPGRGFWEGGRAKRANERQVTWGRTPVLRKRRNRRRLPCQPAPPPRPNRHPPPCPPGQSAVSNASPACFITHEPDPNHPEHTHTPQTKRRTSSSQRAIALECARPAAYPSTSATTARASAPHRHPDASKQARRSHAPKTQPRHQRRKPPFSPTTNQGEAGGREKEERLEQTEVA